MLQSPYHMNNIGLLLFARISTWAGGSLSWKTTKSGRHDETCVCSPTQYCISGSVVACKAAPHISERQARLKFPESRLSSIEKEPTKKIRATVRGVDAHLWTTNNHLSDCLLNQDMAAGNCDLPTALYRRRGLDRVVIMVGAYHSISLLIKDTKFQDHIIDAFNSRLCRCRHLPLWNGERWHSSRRQAQCSRSWLCARMVQHHLIRHVLLFSGARDVQLVFHEDAQIASWLLPICLQQQFSSMCFG